MNPVKGAQVNSSHNVDNVGEMFSVFRLWFHFIPNKMTGKWKQFSCFIAYNKDNHPSTKNQYNYRSNHLSPDTPVFVHTAIHERITNVY